MTAVRRPAGDSDFSDYSDGDEFCFDEPPRRYYPKQQDNFTKKIEIELQDAIINGNLFEVEKIITSRLNNNVNVKLDSGWTPLMHACFHAQDKIVESLLSRGADPNLHADSVTPIMVVSSNCTPNIDSINSIVSNLIEKDAILNVGDKHGQTPLMRAIGSGRISVVQKLLDMKVNIEMRDMQGWTALFWAVHNNQPEILELLIANGARLTEVDKSNRTIMDIAQSHGYENIIELLEKYFKTDENEEENRHFITHTQVSTWHDYYPGVIDDKKLNYASEIIHLLYGMNCERLCTIFENSGMDLRQFLLLDESKMIELGIDLPYERQRLKLGLRNFHLKGWKLNAVAGLYARKMDNYSVLDCLTTLGTHLQQVYILEATLQYTLRDYQRVQEQVKFEPPDSPVVAKLRDSGGKMLANVRSVRREMGTVRHELFKISKSNPVPADLIKEETFQEKARSYATEIVAVITVAALAYHARRALYGVFNK